MGTYPNYNVSVNHNSNISGIANVASKFQLTVRSSLNPGIVSY